MKKGLTSFGGAMTIISTMLGAGINFMPAAFRSLGYLYSIYSMMFIVFLTALTLFTIGYSAHLNKRTSKTYSSIGYDFHKYVGYSVDLTIFFSQFFVGIFFHKYMVNLLILFLFGINETDKNYQTYKNGALLSTGTILYGLSLLKDLSSLKFTSYLSVFSVIYVTILMIFFNFYFGDTIRQGDFLSKNTEFSFGLKYIILGMSCQVNMVSVYSELISKSAKGLVFISMFSSIMGGMIYGLVGLCGYRILGMSIGTDDIIKMFCSESSPINQALKDKNFILKFAPKIAIIGAIIVLLGSFPLQLNPASTILLKIIGRKDEKSRIILITGLFISMLIINIIDVKLNTIMLFLGGILSNSISFFFPSLYYILSVRKVNALSILSGLTILFSLFAGAFILFY
ncbi:putative sodium-coupled neutral amino acid transporter [Vairimorpha necatrix]|uniref:Sodium-coupled neutral amino acid transporter n=1 Tax=Vairimorpha necatrix TaxID=6039 RepID=A0AAX4JFG0_9MICR